MSLSNQIGELIYLVGLVDRLHSEPSALPSVKYLETLDKILNYLGPLQNLEIHDKNLAKILVKKRNP